MNDPRADSDPGGLPDLAVQAAVVTGVGLLFVVLVVGAGYAFDVLMLAFAGLLFAILLRTVTDFVKRHTRMGDKPALAAAVLVVVGVVVGVGWFLVPQVTEQGDELRRTLPKSLDRLTAETKKYETGRWVLENAPEPNDLMPRRRDLLVRITGVFSTALNAAGAVFVVFFIGLYLAVQPRMYFDGITRLVPLHNRDRAREVMGKIGTALRWWLMGKLVAMVFVGALVWLVLLVLGLPFALTLAVIAALLTFVPNFGPIISAVPAVLIGLLDSPTTAVWVVVLFTAIQAVESYVLTPVIQQSVVALPAALTITTQLMLGSFVGGIGVALATPLTLVALVLVRTLYVRDLLGDADGEAEVT
ncbi:AI-2E family transporter [Gemmata sp.]|uniref:AI-2E family transporter n=1 Tax=Gemmata sp. TaxID=1914242 RepID=UPI003F6FEE8B